MRLTEIYDFANICTVEVIIQGLVASTACHFANTRSQDIGLGPTGFDLVATCSPASRAKSERIVGLTIGSMPIDMPRRHCCGDRSFSCVQLNGLGEFLHSLAKVFRPLACDVISNDNMEQQDPFQS
jgi:hypothetical protein